MHMMSTSTSALPLNPTKNHLSSIDFRFRQGIWPFCAEVKKLGIRPRYSPTRIPSVQGIWRFCAQVKKLGIRPKPTWIPCVQGTDDLGIPVQDLIKERVDVVQSMFGSMGDGEISVSAYDTAWVALVKDVNGSGCPQFPSCLQWIVDNQLPDGSWGEAKVFSAYDRILNTLACVVALKTWNIRPDKYEKGLKFIRENISSLEKENAEHMLIAFEVSFPSLVEVARDLDIQISFDSPFFQDMSATRNLKFAKIPKDLMHNVPTSSLYCLEGLGRIMELDWEKLLKLRNENGSFLFSPSSTAFALMHTGDVNCLKFINKLVQKFNGGVPCVYPVDLFEHLWVVDRLERLGISRHFKPQIKDCVDYISKHWTQNGIGWGRNTRIPDGDDTCMAFRILRLHGYNVSAEVLRSFEINGEFVHMAGQSTQSVTMAFNLYRAAEVMFPGEKILEEVKNFCFKFLKERQATNNLFDKWVIMKDLPGEVGYALEVPWYASLPRVEARFYIEQYGGDNDVWIGKVLYKMHFVNNNVYLELAKLDFNNCQALHRVEWDHIQKWFMECEFGKFGMSRGTLLVAYFLAAANIFEPERSAERLAWAKTTFLMDTIASHFDDEMNFKKYHRKAFFQEFKNIRLSHLNSRRIRGTKNSHLLISILLNTLNHLSSEALVVCGRDINPHLLHFWEKWMMMMWEEEGDRYKGAAELLVNTINLCSGRLLPDDDVLCHPSYERLVTLSNRVCHQLGHHHNRKVSYSGNHTVDSDIMKTEIETDMRELVQLVYQNSSDDISTDVKQTFFTVARSFYYAAHCDLGTMNSHIAKVLFEAVD